MIAAELGVAVAAAHILRWVVRDAEELARRLPPPAGSFPRLLLHHTHAILDRRRCAGFAEPLRFRDGSLISV